MTSARSANGVSTAAQPSPTGTAALPKNALHQAVLLSGSIVICALGTYACPGYAAGCESTTRGSTFVCLGHPTANQSITEDKTKVSMAGGFSIGTGGDAISITGNGALSLIDTNTSSPTAGDKALSSTGANDRFAIDIEGGPVDLTVAGTLNSGDVRAQSDIDNWLELLTEAAVDGDMQGDAGILALAGAGKGGFDRGTPKAFEAIEQTGSRIRALTGSNNDLTNFAFNDDSALGNVTINSGGALWPGNSPGIMTVTGDLTVNATPLSLLEINEPRPRTEHGQINIGGIATVDGTLQLAFGSVPLDGDQFALVNPQDLVLEDTVETGLAEIGNDPDAGRLAAPVIDPSSFAIQIDLTQESFLAGTPGRLTANQRHVDRTLNTLAGSDAARMLPGEALPGTFDNLSGVQHTHRQALAIRASQAFQRSLSECLGPKPGVAETGGRAQTPLRDGRERRCGLWLRGFGAFGRIDADSNASGASYSATGLTLGADMELGSQLVAGAALNYTRSSIDPTAGDLDNDSFQAAFYGNWRRDAWFVKASAGLGYHEFDARRQVAVSDFKEVAKSDYSGWTFTMGWEGGQDLIVGNAAVTPFAGLEYTRLRRDSFTGSGAEFVDLAADNAREDSLRTALGLRLGTRFSTTGGYMIRPSIEAAWVHEHRDDTRLKTSFASAKDRGFPVEGPTLNRYRARLNAGMTAQLNGTTHVTLGYQGEITGSDNHHSFAGNLKIPW